MRSQLSIAILALFFPTLASAQTRLIGTGDILSDGTVITDIATGTAQTASGTWAANVYSVDKYILVREGVVIAREGDPVPGLAGATYGPVGTRFDVNDAGEVVHVSGIEEPTATTLGLFFQDKLLAKTGDAIPLAGFPAGSIFTSFDQVELNNARELMFWCTWIEGGGVDAKTALIRLDLAADGTILFSSSFAKSGDSLPGSGITITSIGRSFEFNEAGDVLWYGADAGLQGAVIKNTTVLAQGGGATPVPGLTWKSSAYNPVLAMTDAGEVAFNWRVLPGGVAESLLVREGSKVALTGETLPDLGGEVLAAINPYHVEVASNGTVAWFAAWGSLTSSVFVDNRMIVENGGPLDGKTALMTIAMFFFHRPFSISPDGLTLDVGIAFTDTTSAIYRFDLAKSTTMAGCTAISGSLTLPGKAPAAGETFTISMDQGQAPGVSAYLAFSTQPAPTWPSCGVLVPGLGELLIDVAAPNPVFVAGGVSSIWTGTPINFEAPVPNSLLGTTIYSQGLFIDHAGVAPTEPFRLTNGQELFIGF